MPKLKFSVFFKKVATCLVTVKQSDMSILVRESLCPLPDLNCSEMIHVVSYYCGLLPQMKKEKDCVVHCELIQ